MKPSNEVSGSTLFTAAGLDEESHRAKWDSRIIGAFLLAFLICGLSAVPALAEDITGTASVIDGDTLEIRGQRIRLHGVDAPESSQVCLQSDGKSYRCGQQAALRLSDLIGRRTVHCSVEPNNGTKSFIDSKASPL